MWNRDNTKQPPQKDIGEEERELRELLAPGPDDSKEPRGEYWGTLTAQTNRRVDEVTSGKAISISWAARVAFPGAIAILFFFIGLHYYVPDRIPADVSVTEILSGFSEAGQDSLYDYLLETQLETIVDEELYDTLFEPAEEEIEEYLLSSGNAALLLKSFSDEQINELILLIRTEKQSLSL